MPNWNPREARQEEVRGEPRLEESQVYSPQFRVVNQVQEHDRTQAIQETYRLLAVAVFTGMVGGWLGSRSTEVVKFFFSWPGIIVAMLALNVIPRMTVNVARNNPRLGVPYLAAFGFVAGLILSPLIFVAMLVSGTGSETPNLVQAALVITATIFMGISGYVYKSGTRFQTGQAYMAVAFWAILAAIVVNMWLLPASGALGIAISIAIGLFGGVSLVMSTAAILNDPEFRDPVVGALSIFAGLFNIFQSVLHLLLALSGGRRD